MFARNLSRGLYIITPFFRCVAADLEGDKGDEFPRKRRNVPSKKEGQFLKSPRILPGDIRYFFGGVPTDSPDVWKVFVDEFEFL